MLWSSDDLMICLMSINFQSMNRLNYEWILSMLWSMASDWQLLFNVGSDDYRQSEGWEAHYLPGNGKWDQQRLGCQWRVVGRSLIMHHPMRMNGSNPSRWISAVHSESQRRVCLLKPPVVHCPPTQVYRSSCKFFLVYFFYSFLSISLLFFLLKRKSVFLF